MTGMKLVIPDASMSPEIVAYRQAMLDAGSSMDGCGKLRRLANPADWLAFNEAFSKKETAPAGWGPWTAISQVDTKNKPRRRIAQHYAALLRISNGVRPFFISMRW